MAKLQDVTESDFQDEVLGSEKPVLVDFWAPVVRPLQDRLADRRGARGGVLR